MTKSTEIKFESKVPEGCTCRKVVQYIHADGSDWEAEDYIKLYLVEWWSVKSHTRYPPANQISRELKSRHGIMKSRVSVYRMLLEMKKCSIEHK